MAQIEPGWTGPAKVKYSGGGCPSSPIDERASLPPSQRNRENVSLPHRPPAPARKGSGDRSGVGLHWTIPRGVPCLVRYGHGRWKQHKTRLRSELVCVRRTQIKRKTRKKDRLLGGDRAQPGPWTHWLHFRKGRWEIKVERKYLTFQQLAGLG